MIRLHRWSMPEFAAELRISPKPIIALLALPALVIALEAWSTARPSLLLDFALFVLVMAGVAWWVTDRHALVGRWYLIAMLSGLVIAVQNWLQVPGFLALLALPTALAAPLINLPAAGLTALLQSLLVAALWRAGLLAGTPAEPTMALGAVWGIFGVMSGAYIPVYKLARWSLEHFQHAQELLEEARDRQQELKQALDDLAYANRQLALTNEKLAAARLMAEEAERTKAAFVAKVSHEFRTPLNMIIGLTDLLMETPEVYGEHLPEPLLKDLEIVHRSCEHLSSLVNDVLDLSQVEAGRLALHKEEVSLDDVIQRATIVVRPLLETKALQLELDIAEDLPPVYCDQTRIRQVVLNLLSNAARYTEEGRVRVSARQEAQYVVVSVQDTGTGIAPQDAERIFEPFQQVRSGVWRTQNGTGLGLSISKQFVELHGGRMWLESEVGVGSTFHFRLPVSPLAEPTAGAGRWISEQWMQRGSYADPSPADLAQRLVLYDPTGDLGPLLDRYADETEFVAQPTLDGAVAEIRRVAAQALLVNAPRPERLWPLLLSARTELPDMPILGCSVSPRVERALEEGAFGYLLKPIKRAALSTVLERFGRPLRRILVTDDDPDTLQLLERMLQIHDPEMEVLTAASGAEGLNLLRAERPDAMLLDIILPDLDGWQVLAAKRLDPDIADIPVVVISAQDPQEAPLTSEWIAVTVGGGLSLSRLIALTQRVADALLRPAAAPSPAP